MDSTINLHYAQKFSRSPSLLSARHVDELMSLAASPPRCVESTQATERLCASGIYGSEDAASGKPFIFAGGIALIPVYGALLHRDPWCDRWATGYDYIASRFGAAMGDDDVKGILFDVNSYGGHVAGNFELCDMIADARGKKPMASVVDARALSGGYSIPTATGRIFASPSSEIGSIGVVMLHMSYEDWLKEMGVKATYIFAGKHKVDGNPYQDLPDDVRKAFQASVERSYDKFVALVSKNRGLDDEVVRATQASVYDAEEAQSLGLIDAVMPPRAAYAAFLAEVSTSTQTPKGKINMSNETANQTAAGNEGGGDDAARIEAARNEAKAAGEQAGAKAAQERIGAILNCEEAAKRTKLANHIAFETSMSVDEAKKLLAASSEDKPEAAAGTPGAGPLAEAMAGDTNRTAGAGGGDDNEDDPSQKSSKTVSRIAASYAKATNNPIKK